MAVTFTNYAPFDDGAGSSLTEDGWRAMMRYQVQTGVLRNIDNELMVYGDSTGMQVKVKTGQCVITGHWGQVSSEATLTIAAAHPTLARRDLVVARADFTNNLIELDVITGTAAASPVVPVLTRNTAVYEIPLAVVQVDAAVVTIAAAKVLDARQWGGPLTPPVSDDFLLFGDRISPCNRASVNGNAATINTNVYFVRMQSALDQTVSKIRFYATTARVGGSSTELKIFYNGARQDMLQSSVTVTDLTNFGTSVGAIDERTLTAPISLRAGEHVVVMMRFAGTSTAPVFAGLDVSAGIGANANALLNGSSTTNMTCGFKSGGTMPSTPLNILDGTWATRDRYFWCALS